MTRNRGRDKFRAGSAKEMFGKFSADICRGSFFNSPYIVAHDFSGGNFRGPRGYRLRTDQYPMFRSAVQTAASDGIGTKTILVALAGQYSSPASDLVAMTGGDITRYGGLRLAMTNVLDVETLGQWNDETNMAVRKLMLGLAEVAAKEHLVILGGETAELGEGLGSEHISIPFKFNWSGCMFGIYHAGRMITGQKLKSGQAIVALGEKGFRSNGFTRVREALRKAFGNEWWKSEDESCRAAIRACAKPSVLYDRMLEDANGWTQRHNIPITAIAHLSGGSMPVKFGNDILWPQRLSATLDNLFEPPSIMRQCKEWSGLSDIEAYTHWNGGQGALVVMDPAWVPGFMQLAVDYKIPVRVCGQIEERRNPSILIKSKYHGGAEISFEIGA